MGGSVWNFGTRGAHHGGRVLEQHAVQLVHLKGEMGSVAQGPWQIRYLLRSSLEGPCSGYNQSTHTLARGVTELHSIATDESSDLSTNRQLLAQPSGILQQHTTFAAPGDVCTGLAYWLSSSIRSYRATQAQYRPQRRTANEETSSWICTRSLQQRTTCTDLADTHQQVLRTTAICEQVTPSSKSCHSSPAATGSSFCTS
jgi:hypothetical protein